MRDRNWATGRDRRGGRLFELVLVTIVSLGATMLVVQLANSLMVSPMAAAAAVLRRAAGG